MTDRKGNEIAVGDKVFVIPVAKDTRTTTKHEGGIGYVRALAPSRSKPFKQGEQARVDNGPADMTDIQPNGPWTWSSWLSAEEFERIS